MRKTRHPSVFSAYVMFKSENNYKLPGCFSEDFSQGGIFNLIGIRTRLLSALATLRKEYY